MNLSENIIQRYQLITTDEPRNKALIRKRCELDIFYWLENFCWTHDPRSNPSQLPFIPYPFQAKAIKRIIDHIEMGEDDVIEKSRDMGATWMFVYVFQWFWQFGVSGNDFHVGSQKQEDVERTDDPKSIFWKTKYNIKKQPRFLLPKHFDFNKHLNFLRISNPVTGSAITGEANHSDFSRSGRYKAILYDEFAFWKHTDNEAWNAGGDATKCRFALSTAHGKNNRFYELRTKNEPLRLHWKEHPKKDNKWYKEEKKRRSPAELAQEVDIDYSASVSNKAAENWNPSIHIILNGELKYDTDLPLELNCDFNIDPMCWSVSQDLGKGKSFTFKDYTEQTTITENVIRKFCNDFKDHRHRLVYIYGDRSGRSGGTRSRFNDYDIIKKVLEQYRFRYIDSTFVKNPYHSEMIGSVNKRLKDWEHDDEPYEFVHKDCNKLIDSIESTETKDDGLEKNGIEHHYQAWGYRITKKYPIRKREITQIGRVA